MSSNTVFYNTDIISAKTNAFHQEMGKLIYYFSEIIRSTKFKTPELLVVQLLVAKIISNATAANILIYDECFKEAQMILRSALETVVLIAYLINFPEKTEEYLSDAQILKMKNNFIIFKETKEGECSDIDGKKISKKALEKELVRCFSLMTPVSQSRMLDGIKETKFKINEQIIQKLNNFFKKFKPFFMKLEDMYKEIDDKGFKIDKNFSLRDTLYYFYNGSSQITHGCFLDWNQEEDIDKILENLFHYFYKTTLFLKLILKEVVDMEPNAETREYFVEMKKANDNLEKLIYGKTLDHCYNV